MSTGSAVSLCVRADSRRMWASWIALALIIGLASGAVMAAAAGARRTASAYERLADSTNAPAGAIRLTCKPPAAGCPATVSEAIDAVRAWPGVNDAAAVSIALVPIFDAKGELVQPHGDPCDSSSGALQLATPVDGRFGTDLLQLRLTEGRLADPQRADEAVLSSEIAHRLGVRVGDRLRVFAGDDVKCGAPGTWIDPVDITVVGLGFTTLEIPPKASGSYLQLLHTTPAFARARPSARAALVLDLDDGTTIDELKQREGVQDHEVILRAEEFAGPVEQGLDADAKALWLFALLAGTASICVIGPALGRHRSRLAESDARLSPLGWTRRERMQRGAVHALALWVVATGATVAVMILTSVRTPVGEAHAIEPAAGASFDVWVFVVGAAVLAPVIAALLVLPAVRPRARDDLRRRTKLAQLAARAGLRPPSVMGIRVGLEPDRRNVPIRASLLAAATGGAAVVAVLLYTASVQDLRATPARVGLAWDDFVYVGDKPNGAELAEQARAWPEVEAAGHAVFFAPPVTLGPSGQQARLMAFAAGPDDLGPAIISGRQPAGDEEMLINPLLADALDLQIGDRIDVTIGPSGEEEGAEDAAVPQVDLPTVRFEIVGTGAVPLGDGAYDISVAITIDGYRALLPPDEADAIAGGADFVLVDRRDGVATDRIVARFAEAGVQYERVEATGDFFDNIVSVDRTSTEAVPDLLGLLMAIAGGGVLVYIVVTTIGRNRLDFGIMQSLGFDRRLIRRTARTAGAAQAAAALLVAIPAGILIGRAAWQLYERSLGVVPRTTVPVLEIGLIVIATLVLAVGAASLAARRHRGTTADALRARD